MVFIKKNTAWGVGIAPQFLISSPYFFSFMILSQPNSTQPNDKLDMNEF